MNVATELALQMFPLLRRLPLFAPQALPDRSNTCAKFLRSREHLVYNSAPIIDNPAKAIAHVKGLPFNGPDRVTLKVKPYRRAAKA